MTFWEKAKIIGFTLWRIFWLPILVIICFFVFANVAFGAVQEPDPTSGAFQTNDTATSVTITGNNDGPLIQHITTSSQSFSTSSWRIKIKADFSNNISSGDELNLFLADDAGNTCGFAFEAERSYNVSDTGSCALSDWGYANSDLAGNVDITFTPPNEYLFDFNTQWSTGEDFAIGLQEGFYGNNVFLHGNPTDEYQSGFSCIADSFQTLSSNINNTNCIETTQIEDIYFILNTSGEEPALDGASQTFVTPSDGQTLADFDIWEVETTLEQNATTTSESDIYDAYAWTTYINTTTTFGNDQQDNITSITEIGLSPGETKTIGMPKNTNLSSGDYFAKTEFWYVADTDGNGELEADEVTIMATDQASFTISESVPDSFEDPTFSTSTDLTVTCDPESGFWDRSFCRLYQNLFVPDPEALQKFSEIGDGIREKPPWGYFFIVRDQMEKLQSTTTEQYDLSALDDVDTFDDLKTTIGVILWFIFGSWLFVRFKDIV